MSVGPHRLDGNLRRQPVWKMELSGGNAAEGHAPAAAAFGQLQTGAVAACQQLAVPPGDPAGDDRPHRVQHIAAGKVVGRGDFGLARPLLVALALHQLLAGQPQLHAREGVDGVVDAAMAGHKAAEHLAVGRVDDGVAAQGGDVPLPEIDPRLHRFQLLQVGDALAADFLLQVGVLHP